MNGKTTDKRTDSHCDYSAHLWVEGLAVSHKQRVRQEESFSRSQAILYWKHSVESVCYIHFSVSKKLETEKDKTMQQRKQKLRSYTQADKKSYPLTSEICHCSRYLSYNDK